jgi:hypothetical protein
VHTTCTQPEGEEGESMQTGGAANYGRNLFFDPCRRRPCRLQPRRVNSGARGSTARSTWAEHQQLIGVQEIDGVTYLRLTQPEPEDGEGE